MYVRGRVVELVRWDPLSMRDIPSNGWTILDRIIKIYAQIIMICEMAQKSLLEYRDSATWKMAIKYNLTS